MCYLLTQVKFNGGRWDLGSRFRAIFLTHIFVLTVWAEARPFVSACDEFRQQFPRIRFVLCARGGFGDVSAGYLSALALFNDCPPTQPIQIEMANDDTDRIFSRLVGNNVRFRMALDTYVTGTRENSEVDMIVIPATDQGRLSGSERKITRRHDTVVVKAPVFADSENRGMPFRGFGQISYRGVALRTSVPGPGPHESGIYPDPIARLFFDRDHDGLRTEIAYLADKNQLPDLQNLIDSRLRDARVGLIYGVSSPKVSSFFFGYLKGLEAQAQGAPIVLFSPSNLEEQFGDTKAVNEALGSDYLNRFEVRRLNDLSKGWSPTPGKITLIETPTLPNTVFVGLLAYTAANGLVPLGAGDGFISSAIQLGIPFVLTQIRHNQSVIASLKHNLISWSETALDQPRRQNFHELVDALFTPYLKFPYSHFQRAQELAAFAPEFRDFSATVKVALAEWMTNALFIKKNFALLKETQPENQLDTRLESEVHDPTFRKSLRKLRPQPSKLRQALHSFTQICQHYLLSEEEKENY